MQNSKVLCSEIRALSRPATVQTNIDSEQWFEHFKGILMSDCAIEVLEEAGSDEVITDDELSAPICAQEVDEAIRNLKPRRAAGVDGILTEMLKRSLHLFRPIIVKLFNQAWVTGVFPKDWMKSIIVPLHK